MSSCLWLLFIGLFVVVNACYRITFIIPAVCVVLKTMNCTQAIECWQATFADQLVAQALLKRQLFIIGH